MVRFALFLGLALSLVACGSDKSENEIESLPMNSYKQEISYLIGADHAHQMDQDPNLDRYNKELIIKGFEAGLKNPNEYGADCENQIRGLLGETQQEFNPQFVDGASECIGKFLGSMFQQSWSQINAMNEFDTKYVVYGFKLGLMKKDTIIDEKVKQKMLSEFMVKVNNRVAAEVDRKEKVFFEQVKKIKGIKELPQGIYLETLKAGTGGSPAISEDVLAHYVLMNKNGDTLQSSLSAQPVDFNLSQVIPGWTVAFPLLKKGGKYKLYVPQAMAYGKDTPDPQTIPPFSTLVFYIDFIDYGPAGSFKLQK